MSGYRRRTATGLMLLPSVLLVSCGGGGSGPSGSSTTTVAATPNTVSVVVDAGPSSATNPTINTLYTTVTFCAPGSTTACQTIDHVQVDTGSYGLRVLASALTVTLPVSTASDGNSLAECTQFVDGTYSWGPVATADIKVGGESASAVPIQVIGDSSFAAAPAACAGTGTAEDTVATFGANGILGIGVFAQDCGTTCVTTVDNAFYYSCTQSGCNGITVPLASQVLNPVPLFATDNNGTIIDLPSIASPGASTLTGTLIFGIDTETNNASGTQTVIGLDASGDFTTSFDGATLSQSFVDSGTNGSYFNDGSLAPCPTTSNFNGFYCPASSERLSATITGNTAATAATVDFTVDNAETVAGDNPTFAALPGLAGTFPMASGAFDWGLPFFYGRRVATAIQGHTTRVGTGPYVAF